MVTYSPDIFRNKWLVQAVPGLDTALNIPAESWVPPTKPVDDEWAQIQALYTPLGLSTEAQAAINTAPFIRCFPMQGSTTSNDGKAPEYMPLSSGTLFQPGQVRRRFRVQLNETRAGIVEGLRHVANLSNFGSVESQNPLLVLDFCWPEPGDRLIAKSAGFQPYTVRLGGIFDLPLPGPGGGFPGLEQYVALGGSVSFTFIESELRRAI